MRLDRICSIDIKGLQKALDWFIVSGMVSSPLDFSNTTRSAIIVVWRDRYGLADSYISLMTNETRANPAALLMGVAKIEGCLRLSFYTLSCDGV